MMGVVTGVTGSGATGSVLTGSGVGVPKPVEVAGVEVVVPVEVIDVPVEVIDVPVVEPMPVMVDVGLVVPGIDPAAVLPEEDVAVSVGAGANETEMLIPGGN